MKKKTKTTKKQKTAPFTCVVKGNGIDLNIKLDSTPNFSGFFDAIKERLAASNNDDLDKDFDVTVEDLKAGSAMFVARLPDDKLRILGEEIDAEMERRATVAVDPYAKANGTTEDPLTASTSTASA